MNEKPTAEIVPARLARLEQLRAFRWSSYRFDAVYEKAPGWLCCETVLSFGGAAASTSQPVETRELFVIL